MKFLLLVVIYKKNLKTSETLQSLLQMSRDPRDVSLVVWDNSKSPCLTKEERQEIAEIFDLKYVSTPQNLSLSKIYNEIIRNYLSEVDYLVLLDHDTKLPSNFLGILNAEISQFPDAKLFLPVVNCDEKIVSPAIFYGGWGRYWKKKRVGEIRSKGLVAINSGMVISKSYFMLSGFYYDERLNFYGTDTDFMLKYQKFCRNLVVLDVNLQHSLTFQTTVDQTERLRVYKEIRRSILIINSRYGICGAFLTRCFFLLVGLKYAIKYKSMSYLG